MRNIPEYIMVLILGIICSDYLMKEKARKK